MPARGWEQCGVMWLGFPALVLWGLSPWGARCCGHKEEHRSGGVPGSPAPAPTQGPVLQHSCVAASLQRPGQHRYQQGESGGAGNDAQTIPHLPAATQNQGAERDPSPPHGQQGRKRGLKGILPENCSLPKHSVVVFFFFFPPNSGKCPNLHLQPLLGDAHAAVGSSRCVGDAAGRAGTRRFAAAPGAVGAQLSTRSSNGAPEVLGAAARGGSAPSQPAQPGTGQQGRGAGRRCPGGAQPQPPLPCLA